MHAKRGLSLGAARAEAVLRPDCFEKPRTHEGAHPRVAEIQGCKVALLQKATVFQRNRRRRKSLVKDGADKDTMSTIEIAAIAFSGFRPIAVRPDGQHFS